MSGMMMHRGLMYWTRTFIGRKPGQSSLQAKSMITNVNARLAGQLVHLPLSFQQYTSPPVPVHPSGVTGVFCRTKCRPTGVVRKLTS